MAKQRLRSTATPKPELHSRDLANWALLFCATLAAYGPALAGGVLWDDDAHITKPALQSLQGLWRIWFDLGATQQYYPLLHTAFWMEHQMWGDSVLGYHLVNVALHAGSACLVVLIMRRLAVRGAWLGGFLFALHPVCVEAVAWISEQKSTLSAIFYLGAAFAYLHFDRSRRRSLYGIALALFVMALLSKTVTATLPAVLLVVFWWQRGRIEWKRDVLPLLPWFAAGVAAGLFTAWVERTYIGAQGMDFSLTLLQRILLAGRVLCFYAWKVLWPVNLIFTYPHWNIDTRVWWQYLFPLGVLALFIGLCFAARYRRGPLAGFMIFAGTLFPALGFLNVYPFVYSYVADHFQYLAMLGILIPLASSLSLTMARTSWERAGRVAIPLVLGLLTWRQSGMYRDGETLYRETLARNPASWMARNNLGAVLAQTGRVPEAIADYEAALQLKPDYAQAHSNLASALLHIPGRAQDAIGQYEVALRLRPDSAELHGNLGTALLQIPGRLADAIVQYETALRMKPDSAEAHFNLAGALSQAGRLAEAIPEYETALRLQPDYVEAHFNLANALGQSGRVAEAVSHYRAALAIRPDFAPARKMLEQLR